MEEKTLKKYVKAGEIAKKTKKFALSLVEEGIKLVELAEKIESFIKKEGGGIAFPVNLSLNHIAAHYTPTLDDETTLKDGDLLKVDVGVHVDGYIADTAFTVLVGKGDEKKRKLIEASKKTLETFISSVKPGSTVSELSKLVEEKVRSFGFVPVRNLAGHGLERYVTHASPSIPNGYVEDESKVEEGMAIAMEIFVTDGSGWVKESWPSLIFKYLQEKPVRLRESRKILEMSRDHFKGLPFAKRWLEKEIPRAKLSLALRELLATDAILEYPVLKERDSGLVAQWEETMIITSDGPLVTTLLEDWP